MRMQTVLLIQNHNWSNLDTIIPNRIYDESTNHASHLGENF